MGMLLSKKDIWLTEDNKKLETADMSSEHIINCLNICVRRNWCMSYVPQFLDILRSRGYDKTHPELFI
jgi:hypothetical protein